MQILGFEKLSLVDYNSYACAVIFTGGCNFRCPFCHNGGIVSKSLEVIDEADVISYLEKRKGLLDAVCVSGGEPTLQADLIDFLARLKSIGYKIKLDTNGTNPEVLEKIIKSNLVDYVAMDIKNSFTKYHVTTGCVSLNIEKIRRSIAILKSSGIDYEFRTTLVNEFHTITDIKEMLGILKGSKKLFLQKYVDRDSCIVQGFTPVSKEIAQQWANLLKEGVEIVNLRGYD